MSENVDAAVDHILALLRSYRAQVESEQPELIAVFDQAAAAWRNAPATIESIISALDGALAGAGYEMATGPNFNATDCLTALMLTVLDIRDGFSQKAMT